MTPAEWGAALGSGLVVLAGLVIASIKIISAIRGPSCPLSVEVVRDLAQTLREVRDALVVIRAEQGSQRDKLTTLESSLHAMHLHLHHDALLGGRQQEVQP